MCCVHCMCACINKDSLRECECVCVHACMCMLVPTCVCVRPVNFENLERVTLHERRVRSTQVRRQSRRTESVREGYPLLQGGSGSHAGNFSRLGALRSILMVSETTNLRSHTDNYMSVLLQKIIKKLTKSSVKLQFATKFISIIQTVTCILDKSESLR